MGNRGYILKITIAFGSFLLCLASFSFAEIYTWTDKNGALHYGDRPPSGSNERKISISESNSMKGVDPDFLINRYLNELTHLVEEMKSEIKSCSYNAIERKSIDISCKNYVTLVTRDFRPLINKISSFLGSKPNIKDYETVKTKFDELINLGEETDREYDRAIKYLDYIIK